MSQCPKLGMTSWGIFLSIEFGDIDHEFLIPKYILCLTFNWLLSPPILYMLSNQSGSTVKGYFANEIMSWIKLNCFDPFQPIEHWSNRKIWTIFSPFSFSIKRLRSFMNDVTTNQIFEKSPSFLIDECSYWKVSGFTSRVEKTKKFDIVKVWDFVPLSSHTHTNALPLSLSLTLFLSLFLSLTHTFRFLKVWELVWCMKRTFVHFDPTCCLKQNQLVKERERERDRQTETHKHAHIQ